MKISNYKKCNVMRYFQRKSYFVISWLIFFSTTAVAQYGQTYKTVRSNNPTPWYYTSAGVKGLISMCLVLGVLIGIFLLHPFLKKNFVQESVRNPNEKKGRGLTLFLTVLGTILVQGILIFILILIMQQIS